MYVQGQGINRLRSLGGELYKGSEIVRDAEMAFLKSESETFESNE